MIDLPVFNRLNGQSSNKAIWGLFVAIGILTMAVLGGIAYGVIHQTLHLPHDAMASTQALLEHPHYLLIGIALWSLVALLDVVVSIGLYILYRKDHRWLSSVSTVLRLAYTVFLCVAIESLLALWLSDDSLNAVAYFEYFEQVWSIGLVVFGFHLITVGTMTFTGTQIDRSIAVLLMVAGVAYVLMEGLESLGFNNVWPAPINTLFMLAMASGELVFACLLGFNYWKTHRQSPLPTSQPL